MRLKTFSAPTMTEAMTMIKDTLGDEAVIISTLDRENGVEVTAAIDPVFEIGDREPQFRNYDYDDDDSDESLSDWLQYDEEQEDSAIAEDLTDLLLYHQVPEGILDHILSCTMAAGLEDPSIALLAAIEHIFSFEDYFETDPDAPVFLTGPHGAGKTLATAKLAAQAVMDGQSVGIISCDTIRAGGIEQLAAFTNVLKVPLKKAVDGVQLYDAVQEFQDKDQIFIDMPATNILDQKSMKDTAKMISSVHNPMPFLVLPAGLEAQAAAEIANSFSSFGVENLFVSRTDTVKRFGSLLACAYHGNMAFTLASKTAKVANGIQSASPEFLTKLFMPSINMRETDY